MSKIRKKHEARKTRQKRVRQHIKGSNLRPRLCVYRSLKYTYAQLISDEAGVVLGSASTREVELSKEQGKGRGSVDSAKALGKEIAKLAKEKNIGSVVFDRNGYLYHGRIAAVAEGAREGGLEF
ncbi:MAG TPA: 50S ribosomal protein L18 [Oligoflexia bacterium]|nr:50S ribosomal protein L18 [Oligoflexia bacterium]HMP49190.1 50S ribosomal protein L18 [Oligoflexia bacterium]